MRARRSLVLALSALTLSTVPAHAAEQLATVTAGGTLELIQSDSPGAVRLAVPISGLAKGETILGIDQRPQDGRLYAVSSKSRIYVLDPATGDATPLNTPFAPRLSGNVLGFNVNPSNNALRIVTDKGQNLYVSVFTGQTLVAQGPFTYAEGDPAFGMTPVLGAFGYANQIAGATSSTLYGVDTATATFVQNGATDTALRTIGPLGVEVAGGAAVDLATDDGTAYLVSRAAAGDAPALSTVDLSSGTATSVSSADGASTLPLRSSSRGTADDLPGPFAALGTVPDDTSAARVSVSVSSLQNTATLLSSGVVPTISCDEACTAVATVRVGADFSVKATGTVVATAGSTRIPLRLDAATRALLRAKPATALRLTVSVTDAAGNRTPAVRRTIKAAPTGAIPSKT